jgi:hypothetical protein
MAFTAQGDPVHGEVVSADASGAGVAVLWYPSGSQTARTLLSTEFVTITDVILISTAGGVYDLIFGTTTGAGKHIVKGNADALGGIAHHFETPLTGPVGVNARLIAAAGQVDLIISGSICKA